MEDLELPTVYALIVVLSVLLSLDFIVQWHYHHKRSSQYLIWILLPILYVTFAAGLLAFIERDRTSSQPTVYRALLNWLIAGSLWVSLGLQALIMWRFCSALKNSHFTRAFNIGHLGTFSRPQLLILAVSAVVVGLQAVTFAVPHHIVSLNIRGPILAFSNSLAYLVVFIPEYRVRKHRVRKYTIFSRIEEDETPERARKQARGVLVTTILACLAVMASLSLLAAVLTGNCTWRSFVLWETIPACVSAGSWVVLQSWKSLFMVQVMLSMDRSRGIKETKNRERCKGNPSAIFGRQGPDTQIRAVHNLKELHQLDTHLSQRLAACYQADGVDVPLSQLLENPQVWVTCGAGHQQVVHLLGDGYLAIIPSSISIGIMLKKHTRRAHYQEPSIEHLNLGRTPSCRRIMCANETIIAIRQSFQAFFRDCQIQVNNISPRSATSSHSVGKSSHTNAPHAHSTVAAQDVRQSSASGEIPVVHGDEPGQGTRRRLVRCPLNRHESCSTST